MLYIFSEIVIHHIRSGIEEHRPRISGWQYNSSMSTHGKRNDGSNSVYILSSVSPGNSFNEKQAPLPSPAKEHMPWISSGTA